MGLIHHHRRSDIALTCVTPFLLAIPHVPKHLVRSIQDNICATVTKSSYRVMQ